MKQLSTVVIVALVGCGAPEERTATTEQLVTTCVTVQKGTSGNARDAMLSNPPAGNNFGTQPIVRVGGKDEGLFWFDLGGIPASAAITSATLTLFVNGNASGAPIGIHRATAAWGESTVTYDGFDQRFETAATAIINPTSANAFKSADVMTAVQGWVSGTVPNHGFLLETASQKKTIFVSGEGDVAAQHPALRVCYSTPDDHCAGDPCANGGTCTNGATGFTCSCAPGYTGATCADAIDNCADHPCQNGGACTSSSAGYTCACATGYEGANCETITDNCASNPCANGGTCTNSVGAYTCTCPLGFMGATCEQPCPEGYTGESCSEVIDHCSTGLCHNGGTCVNEVSGYSCACAPGYAGASCDDLIDNCAGAPCLNGGTCTNGVGSYTCGCAPGFSGANCEIDIDECGAHPCENGGVCIDGVASFTCQCTFPYGGATCGDLVTTDPCELSGGTLVTLAGSYTITNAASVDALFCVKEITGTLTVNADASVPALALPSLKKAGAVTITAGSRASTVDLVNLATVTNLFDLENNGTVTRVDLRRLTAIRDLYVLNNAALATLDAGDLTTVGSITLRQNPQLASLGAVGLSHVTVVANDLTLIDNTVLASLGPTGLSSLTSARRIQLIRNPALVTLGSLAALTSVTGQFDLEQQPLLTEVDLHGASLGGLYVDQNAHLERLLLGNLPAAMTDLVLMNNPLLVDLGAGVGSVRTVANDLTVRRNTSLASLGTDGLSSLVSVGRVLEILGNTQLASLGPASLTSLASVGSFVDFETNPLVTSVDVGSAVLGGFYVANNAALTAFRLGNLPPTVSYALIVNQPLLNDIGPSGYSPIRTANADLKVTRTALSSIGPTALSNLQVAKSTVEIYSNPNLATLGDLSSLTFVGGFLDVELNPLVTTMDVHNASISNLWIQNMAALTSLRLGNLSPAMKTLVIADSAQLADLGPAGVSQVVSATSVTLRRLAVTSLGPTGLSNLTSVTGVLELFDMPHLTSLGPTSFSSLVSVGGLFNVELLPLVTSLDARNAVLKSVWISRNALTTLRLDRLNPVLGYLIVYSEPGVTTLGPAELSMVTEVTTQLRLEGLGVATLGLGNLAKVGGGLSIGHNANLVEISPTSLHALNQPMTGALEIWQNPLLTTLDASVPRIGGLFVDSNAALATLSLPLLTQITGPMLQITRNPSLPGCFADLLAQVSYTGTPNIGANGPCP